MLQRQQLEGGGRHLDSSDRLGKRRPARDEREEEEESKGALKLREIYLSMSEVRIYIIS